MAHALKHNLHLLFHLLPLAFLYDLKGLCPLVRGDHSRLCNPALSHFSDYSILEEKYIYTMSTKMMMDSKEKKKEEKKDVREGRERNGDTLT